MGPLDQWADQVPKTAGEINEALNRSRRTASTRSPTGSPASSPERTSLGDAFRSIAASILADTARLIARMVVMKTGSWPSWAAAGRRSGLYRRIGGRRRRYRRAMSTSFAGFAGRSADPMDLPASPPGFPGDLATGGFVSGAGSSTAGPRPGDALERRVRDERRNGCAHGRSVPRSINSGRIPHAKGGGLFSTFGAGMFGLAGLALGGKLGGKGGGFPLWPMFGLAGLAMHKKGHVGAGPLISPLGSQLFHFAQGGYVPRAPKLATPQAGNVNVRGGDTHNHYYQVAAPNTGDPVRDHASALQTANAIRREVSRAMHESK
jgi:hypothetical protein